MSGKSLITVFLLGVFFIFLSSLVKADSPIFGTWLRQGTYTEGVLQHQEPATLIFGEGYFNSFNKYCKVTGTLTIEGNTIKMVTKSTDCYGHTPGTVTTSTFELSADNNTLTIINTEYGAEVKEIYRRSN